MFRHLFLISLFITAWNYLPGQAYDEKDFIHYTTKQGLSDNYISGLEQDTTGYIWISTHRGLNRFDGTIFKQLLYTGQPNSIPDNSIFTLQLFPGNQLSVASDDGAQIINTRTLETRNLVIPTVDALRYWSNACRYIMMDKEGNYGVSTKTGFYIFSPEGKLKKRYDRYTVKDIGRSWMMFGNRIVQMPDGNMIQQNASGFKVYDYRNQVFREAVEYYPAITSLFAELKNTKDYFFLISSRDLLVLNTAMNSFDIVDIKNGQRKSYPSCINLLQEVGWQTTLHYLYGNTWAINSKNKGFFLIRVDTVTRAITCSPVKYFGNYSCTSLFSDNRQRLWVGTTEGLFMEARRPQIIQAFRPDGKDADDNITIKSLFISGNKIFAGTNDRKILVIDKSTKKIIHRVLLDSNKLYPEYIKSFLQVHPDTIWVSTTSRLFWLNTRNYSHGSLFTQADLNNFAGGLTLFKDSRGKIWIGPNSINTVYIYNPNTKKLDSLTNKTDPLLNVNILNSFAEDRDGNIWLGGDAIARWNYSLRRIDTLIERLPSQRNRKKGFTVFSDTKHAIWTLLNDDGIAKIIAGGNSLHTRPENLLRDNFQGVIPTIIEDRIFLCTTDGIGFLNTHDLKAVVFHGADGLPAQKPSTYNFYYDSSDRSTWFACKNIICRIPFRVSSYTESPFLHISEVSVLNKSVIHYPQEAISLKYKQNDLRITLSAINFIDPENMRFAYRMKNKKDTSWIDIGTQQNILLTNISPGRYNMELKMYAYDNKWPEATREIAITIKPPFWQTAWFIIAAIIILLSSVLLFFRYRIRRIKQKNDLDRQLAEMEIKALHAQMNPHFIFNSLNSIREMILNDEKVNASRYLSRYAQLIRLSLEHSQQTFITLRQNIDYLQRYIEMEQIRTNSFQYTMHVDEKLNTDEILLPPMLIQPFIENAIWHGPSREKLPMHLSISFMKENDHLLCIVDDNGIGIMTSLKNKTESSTAHSPLGIGNTRQRLQVINEKYKLQCRLAIEDKNGMNGSTAQGTLVTMHLPLNFNEL